MLHRRDVVDPKEKKLIWKSKMVMPRIEDSIYIDIETDLGGNEVWMIGLLYQDKVTQFTAYYENEEKKILDQFSNYLENLPNKPLICYSRTNFDFRVLWNAAKRTRNNSLLDTMSKRAWLDFCTILGRSCAPPAGSLALKHVAKFFGYKLKHGDYDGLKLSIEYYQRLRKYGSISNKFLKIAEEYNIDDMRIMPYLLEIFNGQVEYSKEFSVGYTTGFIKEIRKLVKQEELTYDIRLDKKGKTKLVRLRCDPDSLKKLFPRVLSAGLPMPLIYKGKKTINLTWSSQLARERAAAVIPNIIENEKDYNVF